ncbi:MAG: ABC transporter ATP-binding protein [Pseudotabrizicola sp.]|uniref:ABC transporter ATP-binding protein n=1 Tax=Pseudotabrizicola sp. TaxID=2939647 RepID=UPI00272FE308|nr:ABC transporter ATP-binding protein [Pseudotabrizicola sp.]MDP2080501.1 ABC transporter ATP-binding protein [Pseudotabrizicola sp.]MDZ7573654.1 ABC transporter ATP-binding protein [Pseudotabrizicola sp.]
MSFNKNGAEVVLRLDQITKRFGALVANDTISLTLHRGEVLALLGENGAGKTTLMNILFGHYLADGGTVTAFGQPLPPGQPRAALAAGIGMVHQHFTLADQMTVLENITLGTQTLWSLGRGRAVALAKVQGLSRDFGLAVDPVARVADLSVGERQRVEILKALYRDARVLILDEPTAVLTPQETEALFQTLRLATARGLSVIFISHKLHEVMGHADTCVVLRHGRVVGQVATKDTDRRALAAMMVGAEMAEASVAPGVPGPVRLSLRGVWAGVLRDATLDLRGGTITGLAGVSGNGQAALADLIGGGLVPDRGQMLVDGVAPVRWSPRAAIGAGVGRIPEDRHKTGTVADFTLAENAVLETYASRFARGGFVDWVAVRAHTMHLIAGYDVRCPGPEARIRLLSGGNMQKLILGRVMEETPGILIANQPVRGLDVGAIAYVHGRLVAARDAGAAVLLISEDLDEVMGLSDVIHVISEGRLSPSFARGELTQAELGLWMAGQGFDHAA